MPRKINSDTLNLGESSGPLAVTSGEQEVAKQLIEMLGADPVALSRLDFYQQVTSDEIRIRSAHETGGMDKPRIQQNRSVGNEFFPPNKVEHSDKIIHVFGCGLGEARVEYTLSVN